MKEANFISPKPFEYLSKEVEMALLQNVLYIVAVLCAIWVIYDVLAKNKKLKTGIKVLWIVCAILFSIITAIVYYFVYKK